MKVFCSFLTLWHIGAGTIFGQGFQPSQPLGSIGGQGQGYPSGSFPMGAGFQGIAGVGGGYMRPVVRPIKVELECVTSNVGRGVIRWVRQIGPVGSEFDVIAEGPTVFDLQRFNVIYTPLLDSWRSKLIINMADPSLQQGIYMCQSPNPLPPYNIQSSEPFNIGNQQMSIMQQPTMLNGGVFGMQGHQGNSISGFGGWRSAGNEKGEIKEEKRMTHSDPDQYINEDGTLEPQFDDKKKRNEKMKRLTQSDPDSPYINDDGTLEPQYDDKKKRNAMEKRLTQSDPGSPYINDDGTLEPQFDDKKKRNIMKRLTQSDPDSPYINDDGTLEPQYDDKKKRNGLEKRLTQSDPESPYINDDGTLEPQYDDKKKRLTQSDPDDPYINDDGTLEAQYDDKKKRLASHQFHIDGDKLAKKPNSGEKMKKDMMYDRRQEIVQVQASSNPVITQVHEHVMSNHVEAISKEREAVPQIEEKRRTRRASGFGIPIVNEDGLGYQHDLGALDEDFPVYRNDDMATDWSKRGASGQPEFPLTGVARGKSHDLGALDEDFPVYRNDGMPSDWSKRGASGQPEFPLTGVARGTSHVLVKRG